MLRPQIVYTAKKSLCFLFGMLRASYQLRLGSFPRTKLLLVNYKLSYTSLTRKNCPPPHPRFYRIVPSDTASAVHQPPIVFAFQREHTNIHENHPVWRGEKRLSDLPKTKNNLCVLQ
eukprot:TRINITY_DN23325_c0_g1_i1.p2 TRINITY_DN23325_c0_g1~~TRINITY_DN23325_c0_g1_i1.p2  ORF type:complete len:117 (+),score=2.33 TRINITY_DN23325_c0_g1_i1:85-435(+)